MDMNKNSISFVPDNIQNYQTIVDEASLNSSVFVLDSSKDVLSQIAAITAQYSSLDSIHLFSHGSSGKLNLGSVTLNSQTLQNYHEILAQIGTSLTDNGDILLYGCNVASGANGIEFISKLSQATETDIAASDDVTGASDKGGDWVLEASTGSIEAHSMTIGGFSGLLSNQPPVFTDATASISTNSLGSNTSSLDTQVMDMSIALATNGTPYAASMNYGDKLTVTKLTGGTWTVVGTADFTPGNAQDVHMVLDGNDTPYVLFQDMSNSGSSTVMKFDGTSWVQVGSAISSGQTYQHFLDVDNNGNVYVEYALSNTVYVKEFNGSNWVSVGSSIAAAGSYSHFAIAQDNTPYLAYCDGANNVIVDKWDGSAWIQVGAVAASNGAVPYLAFDGNDNPIIGYLDSTDNYALHVSEFNGTNWNALGGTISGNYQGSIASISVDAQGNIYAGYKNASGNLAISLWNGTSWNELWNGPQFDGMGGQKATLLTGHDGNVFFGYPDNLGTNYAIVSNVALPILSLNVDENLTTIGTINVTDPENDGITLNISGGPDASAFTLNGATLEFNTAADYETPTDLGHDNIYSVELTATDAQNNTTTVLAMVQVNDVVEGGGGGNSAPEITHLDGDSVSIAQGATDLIDVRESVPPFNGIATVTDSDSADFNNGYLLIHQTSGSAGNLGQNPSVFWFGATGQQSSSGWTPQGDSTLSVGEGVYFASPTLDTDPVEIGTVISDGLNGSDLKIEFNASATPEAAQILLEYLNYSADSTGTRTFKATVNDGTSTSNVAAFTVEITAAPAGNTAPSITNLDGDSAVYTGANYLDVSQNATVYDAEFDADLSNSNWSGATLTVQRHGGALATDLLTLSTNGVTVQVNEVNHTLADASNQVFATYNSTNGVLTVNFTGSGTAPTQELVQHVVQSLYYELDSSNGGVLMGDAIFDIALSDGTESATATATVKSYKITVTNNADTSTIDRTDGVSFKEAIAIAAVQTSSQTEEIILASGVTSPLTTSGTISLGENIIVNADYSNGETLAGGTFDPNNHTLTFYNGSGDTYTVSSVISGSGTLAKTGAGKVSLTGENYLTGIYSVGNGILSIGSQANLDTDDSASVSLNGGTLEINNASATSIAAAFTVGASGGVISSVGAGAKTISDTISGTGDITFSAAGSSDSASPSTMIVSATNSGSHSGQMIVDMANQDTSYYGVLQIAGDGNLGSGTLKFNSGGLKITGNSTIDNAIDLYDGNGTYLFLNNGTTTTFSGNMTDSGMFKIYASSGTAAVEFTGTNTNDGGVQVANGATLMLHSTGNSAIADSAKLAISSGGTVMVNNNETIARLVVTGDTATLNLLDKTMIVSGEGSQNSAFGGTLSGSGNLVVQDIDQWASTFTVQSTQEMMSGFSGTTKVNSDGKLIIDANSYLGGSIEVENTGTLQGTGTALGSVTVQSGGVIAVGGNDYTSSVGTLTIDDTLNVASGGKLNFTIKGTTAGTTYDQLVANNAVDITGSTLELSGTTYTPQSGDVFTILKNESEGLITGTFNGLAEGATVTFMGVDMTISYIGGNGNDITLTAPSVSNNAPENTISAIYTTNEDTVKHITDLAVSDTDGDTLTVTLWVDHGTISLPNINTASNITALDSDGMDGSISFSGRVDDINLMLDEGVDFYPAANVNGNEYATLTMTTSDDTADNVVNAAAINVTAVNDAPTFELHSGYFDTSFTYNETYGAYSSDEYASCNASVLLPDGSIINVGDATFEGTPYVALTKLNSDGTPNADFGRDGFKVFDSGSVLGGGGSATSVAVEPDGKIVMSGYSDNSGVFLAILNSDGSSDSIIDVAGDLSDNNGIDTDSLYLDYIALQADGKIVLAGGQNPVSGDGGDVVLVRYNADGTLDTSFGTDGSVIQNLGNADACDAITIDASGNILLAVDGGDNDDMGVAKFDSTGALVNGFGSSGIAWSELGSATAGAIKIDSNGKIVLAGSVQDVDDSDIALARFNAYGMLDTNFSADGTTVFNTDDIMGGNGGDDYTGSLAIDANGAIYVGGEFGFHGENAYGDTGNASFETVARFTSSGALDTNFAQGGMIIPEYVQEGYLTVDTQSQDAENDGYWDSDNDPHGDSGSINSILVQPDGKIVLGGSYSIIDEDDGSLYDYSGMTTKRIDTNGNLDTYNFGYSTDTVAYSDTDDFTEGGDEVTIGASSWSWFNPRIYDVEQNAADNYNGGTLTIHRAGGANSEDLINFDTSSLSSAGITLEGTSAYTGNIKHGGSTFATFSTSTAGQLVINFVAGSTQTLVDAITASISYDNTNDINPAYDEGEVELSWIYNDGDEQETTSSCYISIEGDDDGGIEGTVTVSGTPITGTTLSITGLDTITDPDLVTDENEDGTVPEDDLSFQWQVSSDGGETWENIDGAYNSTFEVTQTENGKEIRVVVGYEDPTNGSYTEIQSGAAEEDGGDNGGGNNGGGGNSGGGGSTPTTPTTPPSTTTTVDGATVQTTTTTETRTTTDANGHTTATTVSTEKIVIAPVTSTRAEQTGNATTADVPLFWGESTRTEWATTASIPTGVGLTSEGSRAPAATQTKATAIDDLIYYIDTTAPSTDSSKTTMLGGGETFLQALSNIETLVVNKITLSATTIQAPQAPITITGVANTISTTTGSIAPQEALVIDAQTLPSHSTLQLQNVEFAVIIGEDLTIRGGEGKNILFSGAGSQDIMLGEDDDELHAGAGDDTVGSAGGDDKVFGEAGNDTVFGGEGDDLLHGGSQTDIATYSGNMADYIITRDEGKTYVALASNPNEIDTLINVETITFADSSYTVESTAVHEKIATLYTQVFDRQADIDGFQYWAHDYNDGLSLGGLVVSFMKIADSSWNTKNTSEQIEMLYEYVIGHSSDIEGKNYWINDIQNNHMTIEDVAECFIDLLGQYQLKDDWNFSL